MALFLVLALLAQTPALGDTVKPAALPGTDRHGLGEEEITGQVDVRVTDTKIFFAPQINPFSPIADLLIPDSYVFDDALYKTLDSVTVPHHFIGSSYLRVPVEKDFIYGDIMVFLPTFEKRVATWELVVSNSLGETVRRVTRKGHPPAVMSWDGRTDNGDAIITGEIYSFTFNAYDSQGNQTRIPGTPRRINAMVYRRDNETTVSLAADQIFGARSTRLLEGAAVRLDETANIIREQFHKEVVVYVYSEQEQLSTDRCNVIRQEIGRRLVLPEGTLKVAPRFIPGLEPKFSKVEVKIL